MPPFWRTVLRGNGPADDVPVDRWQVHRFSAMKGLSWISVRGRDRG